MVLAGAVSAWRATYMYVRLDIALLDLLQQPIS